MHIGHITGSYVILLELVYAQADLVARDLPLGIDIVHLVTGIDDGSPIFIRNHRSKSRHGLQKETRQQQRKGTASCRQGAEAQLFHDALCRILSAVPGNFGHHHITFPYVTPDNLVDLVHKMTPVKPVKEKTVCIYRPLRIRSAEQLAKVQYSIFIITQKMCQINGIYHYYMRNIKKYYISLLIYTKQAV